MGQISSLRILFLILLFGLTAFFVFRQQHIEAGPKYAPLSTALEEFGGWQRIQDQPLSQEIVRELKLDDHVFRSYRKGNDSVSLYVGYYLSAKNVGAAHDPLVCFPGQGWNVEGIRLGEVNTRSGFPAVSYSSMIAERDGLKEMIFYWFQAYDHTSPGTLGQKVSLLRQRFLKSGEDNAFVRISCPIGDRPVEEAHRIIDDFIVNFYPVFLSYVRGDAANGYGAGDRAEAAVVVPYPFVSFSLDARTAKAVFFMALFFAVYVYIGYPLSAWLISCLAPRPVRRGAHEPGVTIVIAAYNEAQVIGQTIENKLTLDYPREKLEIIVISDGSTDRTDAIVEKYADDNVRLLRQEPRGGKTSALNMAVSRARGNVIVFSDANSLYAPDAVRRLVENFADPAVGYVTGKMIYANPDGTTVGDGCSAYMKYENALREVETRFGSIVGVDGGIDAMRKELYDPMSADQLPDFVMPLKVVEQGYRVVYEPRALLKEPALGKSTDEYRMRVRVSLRALWALYDMRQQLSFMRHPLFAWQLWSHKVLRYLCFFFIAGAYGANLVLLDEGWAYRAFFMLQSGCYIAAAASPLLEKYGCRIRLITFSKYFALLNVAAAHAFGKFLLGKKQVIWTPRKG